MEDKLLSLDEIKKLQVDMLVDIDKFCRANDITYYLSYGTLLGAIRHKGYIPWDDDIDIMMTRSEIKKFKSSYKSNRYKFCDYTNEPNYEFAYPRVVDCKTYKKYGFGAKTYGVFIDVYVIDAFPPSEMEISSYRRRIERIRRLRAFLIRLRNRVFRYLPIKGFPFIKKLTKRQDQLLGAYPLESSSFVHASGHLHPPINKSIFSDKIDVDFEGYKMIAPSGWDEFLHKAYGDYMQLPPEDKRHPYHSTDKIYLKS